MNARVRRSFVSGLLAAAVVGGAAAASAQEIRPERPYRGLFASRDKPLEIGQTLDLNWSLLGAYDDNVVADSGSPIDPRYMINGTYGTLASSLHYLAKSRHASFAATVGTGGRYYPDLQSLTAVDGNAGVTFEGDLGQRTRLEASQNLTYAPYYQLNLLGSLAPSTVAPVRSGDSALQSRESRDADGRFALTQEVGRRSSIRFEYTYRQMQFDESEKFNWQLGGVLFRHNMTRDLGLRLGYGYGRSRNTLWSSSEELETHNIDAGIDFNRALSFSRRTKVSFSTGSTVLRQIGENRLLFLGDASVTREIGRTWNAEVGYHRGVQFFAGFSEPLYADSVQARVGGLVSRRLRADFGSGYSAGSLGFGGGHNGYTTYSAVAGFDFALTRTLAIDVQYAYYRYGFDNPLQVPLGLPMNLDRQGLRFGLSGWLPLSR